MENGFENGLVVCNSEKNAGFFIDTLNLVSCSKITIVKTCGEARRILLERDFDICIINSPLLDESGERLAKDVATTYACQVLLVIKMENYDAISAKVEDFGVATIGKPINRNMFLTSLKFLKASSNRLKKVKNENNKLTQQIKDIKLVDRAKCLLIAHTSISEVEAHKYIEKQAMNLRLAKREIATDIINKYENA